MNTNVIDDRYQVKPAGALSSGVTSLHASWLVGKSLCRPGTGVPKKPPDWCKDPSAQFASHEKALLKQCVFYAGKARGKAQEDVASSCQLFAVARLFANNPTLGPEAKLLCQSEIEAAEAYLDYVCEASAAAKQRLMIAMKADETLENEYGHPDLHTHRIHLANNIVKVEARSQRLPEALILASHILHYIDNEVSTLPLPGEWGGTSKALMPDSACRFLARQTTMEVGCATADPKAVSDFNVWNNFYNSLGPTGPHSACRGEPREWYAVKHAFLQSRREPFSYRIGQYFAMAAGFLAQGPRESVFLWKLVALDVAFACASLSSETSLQLCADILDDLSQATFLPRHVRGVVARLKTTAAKQRKAEQFSVHPELLANSAA
jgi:hypothetical protein